MKKKKIDIFFKEFSPMFHGHSDKFLDQLEPLNNVINLPCSYHAHATNNAQHSIGHLYENYDPDIRYSHRLSIQCT